MKPVRAAREAIRNHRAGRYCFGTGVAWLLAALLVVLTDAWIGANWLNSPAPGFIIVGTLSLLITLIFVWRDR